MSPSRRPLALLLGLLVLVALPMVVSAQTGLPVFNVKTYGATGDGTTDDTTAILAAFTAAGNNSIVYFPAGTYSTSTLQFIGIEGVTIRGQGFASLLKRRPGGGNDAKILSIQTSNNIIVEYMGVDLNNCLSYCSGIEVADVNNFRIQYNRIIDSNINTTNTNDKFGITVQGNPPSWDTPGYVLYNILEDTQLEIDRMSNLLVQGNKIIRPRFTAGIGTFTNSGSAVTVSRNVTIVDNVVQDADVTCGAYCVILDPAGDTDFTYANYTIARNVALYSAATASASLVGIKIGTGNTSASTSNVIFRDFLIADNYIWTHPTVFAPAEFLGVHLASGPNPAFVFDRFTIENNHIVGPNSSVVDAIDLRMVENSVVRGNVVANLNSGTDYGFYLARAKHLQVYNNAMYGTGGIGFVYDVVPAYDVDVRSWGNITSGLTTAFDIQGSPPTGEYWLQDFTYSTDTVQTLTAASETISTWAPTIGLTSSTPLLMTSTPTLVAGRGTQVVSLMNVGAALLTLQDDRQLNGTRLFLQSSTVTLAQYQTMTLRYFPSLDAWMQDASPTSAGRLTIASGTAALGTTAISAGTCAAAVTAAATGTLTTDVVTAGFAGDPTAITGYLPTTAGMLTILSFPTADTVNFKVCNNTAASITPGAVTLNWSVAR